MRNLRNITFAALCAVATLTACSHVTESPIEESQPVLAGPKGVLKSPEQQASEAAIKTLTDYYALTNRLAKDKAAELNQLDKYVTGTALDDAKKTVDTRRTAPNGDEQLLQNRITQYDIPKDENGTPTAGTATLRLDTCIATPKNGKPNGAATPVSNDTEQIFVQVVMTDTAWPDASGWRITNRYVIPQMPCNSLS